VTIDAKDHMAMARDMADDKDPVFQHVVRFLERYAPTSRQATDVSGTWSGAFTPCEPGGSAHESPVYMVLKQAGSTLTGTAGPGKSQQFPIQNGTVDGDHLTFDVQMGGGGIALDLKLVAGELRGEMQLTEGRRKTTAKAILRRVEP
jgi:hypothetical protein